MKPAAGVWITAARPKTLTAGIVPVLVGSSLAYHDRGAFRFWIFVCTLLSALLIQIGTNFINDAWDFKKGADTSDRLGPPRVTQLGLVSPEILLRAAAVILAAAVLLGVPLVMTGGLPILVTGLCAVFFSWGYTAGPFPLAYNGLGEVFVLIFFGFAAVGGTYFLQTDSVTQGSLLAGAQVGFLATLIIAINNLRDIEGDCKAGKKTTAVLFGERFGKIEIAACCAAPFLLGLFWYRLSPAAALIPLLLAPLAISVAHQASSMSPGSGLNSVLVKAALLHALFGLSVAGALAWG